MEYNLSDFIKRSKFLLLELPLYAQINVCKDIEENCEYEILSYDEEGVPTQVNIEIWKENYEFYMLRNILIHHFKIYGYCPKCEKEVFFKRVGVNKKELESPDREIIREYNISSEEEYKSCVQYANEKFLEREEKFIHQYLDESRNFTIELQCTSPKEHRVVIHFHYNDDGQLVKYGQYPSIIDFDDNLIKLKGQLKQHEIKELNRAIGLKAHGIGVGSFVYLRRIFEKLIYSKYIQMNEHQRISSEEFKKKRMDEKIKYLRDYLPEFLVKNPKLYGILSKGVHELSEKDCLRYFDDVKNAIFFILSEEVTRREEEKLKDETEKAITKISTILT